MAGSWGTPTRNIVDCPISPSRFPKFSTLSIVWTADAEDGTVPDLELSGMNVDYMRGRWLYQISTKPGSTAPTADYDITVETPSGYDVTRGALANRSETAEEVVNPQPWPIDETLTIKISNNSVNSATGTIKFWLSE